jgi:hypothetical protein
MSYNLLPFEYSKIYIKNKNYSKELLLQSVLYMLDIKDEYIENILLSISKNQNFGDDKIILFMIIFYLYTIVMNSYTLVFKEKMYDNLSININNYFNGKLSANRIYGETLINLSIGILLTECLDLINEIKDDNLIKFVLDIYDNIEKLYNQQLIKILSNSLVNQSFKDDINKYDEFLTKMKDNIYFYIESYGDESKIDNINEGLKNDISSLIKNK